MISIEDSAETGTTVIPTRQERHSDRWTGVVLYEGVTCSVVSEDSGRMAIAESYVGIGLYDIERPASVRLGDRIELNGQTGVLQYRLKPGGSPAHPKDYVLTLIR